MRALPQVREGEVPAGLAATYRDIRLVLRAGYVPLPLRALAAVPGALKPAWRALRPNLATRAFETAADELRSALARAAASLGPPLIEPVLASEGCDVDGLDELRAQVHRFQYADPKAVLAVELLDALLAGEVLGGVERPPSMLAPLPPPPDDLPPLVLAPEAPGGVLGEVLAEILRETHLPAATADLLALGRWPRLLETAWEELGPIFHHRRLEHALAGPRALARRLVRALPHPMALAPEAFPDAHAHAESHLVIGHFAESLPRLALFVAALRVALDGPGDALDTPFEVAWPEAPDDLEPAPP
jgi:hypothetical protein